MNQKIKVFILLGVITFGVAFGGYWYYKNYYVKPRVALAEERQNLENEIENRKAQIANMKNLTQQLQPLYARSLPRREESASLQYEIWLTQILEFCNVQNVKVRHGARVQPRNSGYAVQSFQVDAQCDLYSLTQFLYEFYWSPFLQRITALNVDPTEGSDTLQIAMVIEGLTIMYQAAPNQTYPLVDQLPLATQAPKQLASGPFASYSPMAELDVFRAVRTGVDPAELVFLTGTPSFTDENGETTVTSRWNFQALDKTVSLKVGEELRVGAFVATISDIDEQLVVLKQNTGRLWILPLGEKLSSATAVPPNLF